MTPFDHLKCRVYTVESSDEAITVVASQLGDTYGAKGNALLSKSLESTQKGDRVAW